MSLRLSSLRSASQTFGAIATVAALAWQPGTANAEEVLNADGAFFFFDDFTAAGFASAPAAGQLDSDCWIATGIDEGDFDFGETAVGGGYGQGLADGAVGGGGIWAFTIAEGDVALGVQPTGNDFSPGAFVLRLENTTGGVVNSAQVVSTLLYRNNAGRSSSMGLEYSTDGSTFTPVAGTEIASPDDADGAGWVPSESDVTLQALGVAPDGFLYLRWIVADIGGSGSRDEFAINDIAVEALEICGDGNMQGAEACDDGNVDDTDECTSMCLAAACGDGFVHDGFEECDDGNRESNDACISCVTAECGDGFVNEAEEECDDGNEVDDDDCANDCSSNVGPMTSTTDASTGGEDSSSSDGESTTGDATDSDSTTGDSDPTNATVTASSVTITATASASASATATATAGNDDDDGGDESGGQTSRGAGDGGGGCSVGTGSSGATLGLSLLALLGLRRRRD